MTHFLERRDPWGNSSSAWVLALMVFLVPLSVWGLSYTRMENEVQHWLDKNSPTYQAFNWYDQHFPTEEAVIFTWDGSHLNDPRIAAFVNAISGEVDSDGIRRGGLKQVAEVRTPQDLLAEMVKHDVPRDEALRRLQGVLIGPGALKVRLTEAGRQQKAAVIAQIQEQAKSKLHLNVQISEPAPIEELMGAVKAGEPLARTVTTAAAGVSSPAAGDLPKAAQEGTEKTESSGSKPISDEELTARLTSFQHDLQVDWPGLVFHSDQVTQMQELLAGLRIEAIPGTPGVSTAAADKTVAVPVATEQSSPVEASFLTPGSPILVAITLSEAGLAERNRSFQLLIEKAEAVGVPRASIHLGGRPVVGSALNMGVLHAVWDSRAPWYQLHRRSVVLLSWLVGVVVTFWVLRNFQLGLMVLGVSWFAVLLATALVPITGGSMNMVVVVMPTLLFVTTLSGTIHFANYWQHEAIVNPQTAVLESLKAAKSPCIWASMTTAFGLASLLTSSLQPVRDFGLYAAVGTLISLFVILVVLPALLMIMPPRIPKLDTLDHAEWRSFGGFIADHWKPVVATLLIAAVIGTAGLTRFQTETKVIRYFGDATQVVRDYRHLENKISGVVPIEVLVRFDKESQDELKFVERQTLVLQIEEQVKQLPDVSGCLSLADFLPHVPPPEDDARLSARTAYAAKSRTIENRVRTQEGGQASFYRIVEEPTKFNAAGDEIWRITAQCAVMTDAHYGTLCSQIEEICRTQLREVSGASTEKYRTAGTAVAYHPGASHLVTGMVPVFMATQEELLRSLINSFLLAFVTIGITMMALFRQPLAGLIGMIPNVLPIGFLFGVISWSGLRVDIGTVVTASIALGIAVDGTLHLVTWFQIGISRGMSRRDAVRQALSHCGPAMWQTSLIVALGLIVLYPAELVLVSRFGWLMASLILVALVADLCLTPALLAGPMGYLLEQRIKRAGVKLAGTELLDDTLGSATDGVGSEPERRELPTVPRPHVDSGGKRMMLRNDPPGL